MDLQEMIDAYQQGTISFDQAWPLLEPIVHATSRSYVRTDHKDYHDIVSDACALLPEILDAYDPSQKGFRSYLRWKLRNAIVDGIRTRNGRGSSRPRTYNAGATQEGGASVVDRPVLDERRGEVQEALDKALSEMNKVEKMLFSMRFVRGMTYTQIAEKIGFSGPTVSVLYNERLIPRYRGILDKVGIEREDVHHLADLIDERRSDSELYLRGQTLAKVRRQLYTRDIDLRN
ncbi:MAG: sigma-70 family RNA polymerase sigma factor [Nanoarchaeota archaeon]